jgi:hypothetical protein
MANRTVKGANTIKGTNPQFLIEKIIRSRIYESRYWKEECFALTAELLVDKALQLKVIIQEKWFLNWFLNFSVYRWNDSSSREADPISLSSL